MHRWKGWSQEEYNSSTVIAGKEEFVGPDAGRCRGCGRLV